VQICCWFLKLTETSKIVEFYPDRFFDKDFKNDKSIFVEGFLDLKDGLYKFCDLP
jgi:hypothetical protein